MERLLRSRMAGQRATGHKTRIALRNASSNATGRYPGSRVPSALSSREHPEACGAFPGETHPVAALPLAPRRPLRGQRRHGLDLDSLDAPASRLTRPPCGGRAPIACRQSISANRIRLFKLPRVGMRDVRRSGERINCASMTLPQAPARISVECMGAPLEIQDIGHGGYATADARSRLECTRRFQQIVLTMIDRTQRRLSARVVVVVARSTTVLLRELQPDGVRSLIPRCAGPWRRRHRCAAKHRSRRGKRCRCLPSIRWRASRWPGLHRWPCPGPPPLPILPTPSVQALSSCARPQPQGCSRTHHFTPTTAPASRCLIFLPCGSVVTRTISPPLN